MICSSPHAEKEDMLTKRQKIDEVSENNGGAKSVQVFRSRVESYEDDDEDENEPLVIKRTTEAFRQKTNHGNSLKSRKEITSLKDSAPKVGSNSGIPMLAKNKHKASHSKEAKVLSSDRLSTKETERSPVIPGISTPSANKHLPSRPSISEQVSSGLRPAISRDNLRAEDSDDDMPLSYRQSQSKAAPETVHHHIRNGLSLARDHPSTVRVNSSPNCQRSFQSSDDSDDDRPLSQRLLKKLPTEAETRRPLLDGHGSHDDKKPLGARKLANEPFATTTPAKPSMKDNAVSKKRAVDERVVQSVGHSSKKLKETVNPIKSVAKIEEVDDEDDIPLAQRFSASGAVKLAKKMDDSDEDDIPLVQRFSAVTNQKAVVTKKPAVASKTTIAVKKVLEARKAKFKTDKKDKLKHKKDGKLFKTAPGAGGGQKWTTLEHNGVIFPPPYKPHGIKMLYEGKPVDLSPEQEEVATMFAVMRDTDYATKPKFLANFWNDWKKILRPGHVIKSLEKCDFTPIYQWHLAEKEKKKQMSTEEKKILKEEKLKQEEKYMWALVDGVKEKVGNFRVEPPGLFRGRGEHPKMGKLKRRIVPEDITINIGKGAPIPDCPIPGHRWKEVRHDNTVTWLAFWNDPINVKEFKYVFLAASSSLKGQSDKEKYEKARKLKDYIGDIRKTYTKNFMSSDETTRQIAVATYLIDRLALRAGNEKDDDEADTVGCCSLKVEHVTLIPPRSLEFDFLGKDSIRYNNIVEVEAPVYKAIGDFKKSKKEGQDLFDKLDTTKLNAHLKEIMPGLTAKVFRTYNASITLDNLLVDTNGNIVPEKIASYNTANKEVAVLCNHQRSVSKAHGAQMEKLEGKMAELEALLEELKVDLKRAKKGKPPLKDADGKTKRIQTPEALQKRIMQTNQKIEKMKLDMRLKDDLKTVALGTSKINYMDPRITVSWCKRHEVPIEKIFNKSLLAKFAWAMDVEMEFRF